MKQYTFKDGTKVIASSVEEAKFKHKITATAEEYAVYVGDEVVTPGKSLTLKEAKKVADKLKKQGKKEVDIYNLLTGKLVTAKFSPDETSRLEKCLELLEKQCAICGLKLYFELDNEKEYVNVYLKPDKKNVYLTVNVGSDSTATAMYDIWKTIYSKI